MFFFGEGPGKTLTHFAQDFYNALPAKFILSFSTQGRLLCK